MDGSNKYFFRKFIRPYAHTIAFLIALEFVSMIFLFISPLLTKSLIDDVFLGGRTELFGYILLGTAGTYIVSSLSTYLSGYKKGNWN